MKLGRLPRKFDSRIPHFSALVAGRRRLLAPPPASVDYITPCGVADFGAMMNNSLGDCTCAAVGHARQIWTGNANPPMKTVSDNRVVELYSAACGYVPGNSQTDQGGDEQTVLKYWMLNGLPLDDGTTDKLTAYIEVDPSSQADVKSAIADCALVYAGFEVPDYAMNSVGQLWDVQAGNDNPNIVGGHAVILAGYDTVGPECITWGKRQKMTWAFFNRFFDETYAPIDKDFVTAAGTTPLGMSTDALENAMWAMRAAA